MHIVTKVLVPSEVINDKTNSEGVSEISETKIKKSHSEVFYFYDNDHQPFTKLDQKTTQHALLSDQISETGSQPSINQLKTSNQQLISYKTETHKLFLNIRDKERTKKQNFGNILLERSRRVLSILSKLGVKLQPKLLIHLSKTSTADKYIRLIYSLLKLYRALNPKNNLSRLSKELLNTRRIIQWDTKYQLIKQLMKNDLSAFQTAYKTFQLFGTLFDFFSLILHCLSNGSQKLQQFCQILYQWQDDCYFYQCLIELILSTKKFIQHFSQVVKQNQQNQKNFSFKHRLTILRQTKEKLLKKINFINTLQQQNCKVQQNSECIIMKTLEDKLSTKQAQIQNFIKNFKTSLYETKKNNKKQALKNGIKVIKYICDCTTSFNNYSRKTYDLNPTFGGILSIFSSILSLSLIWMF